VRQHPQVGARVKYRGGANFGPVVGTVKRSNRLASRVLVQVDTIPRGWPWRGTDKFCPLLSEIEPVRVTSEAAGYGGMF
jgi:hypothetical protein